MKKILVLLLVLTMIGSCSASAIADELPTMTLWTSGSQNVADLFTALIEAYNAKADRVCNVKLQFLMSGGGEEGLDSRIAAAYLSNQTKTDFDLITYNISELQSLIDLCGSDAILRDVDFNQIEGYENVVLFPNSDLSNKVVFYRCTTVVLAYDTGRVSEDELPRTWDQLEKWIVQNPGRFAYNEPSSGGAGRAFVQAAVYRLIEDKAAMTSNDPAWVEHYDAGLKWLTNIHPYLYQAGGNVLYPNKNQGTIDLLINHEVDIIPAWADAILSNIASGTLPQTTGMYQLEDFPLTGGEMCLVMPSIGSNVDGAYDFIGFVLSPEGQKLCLELMKAIPVIDMDLIESSEKELVSELGDYNIISIGNLWNKEMYPLWQENVLLQ